MLAGASLEMWTENLLDKMADEDLRSRNEVTTSGMVFDYAQDYYRKRDRAIDALRNIIHADQKDFEEAILALKEYDA